MTGRRQRGWKRRDTERERERENEAGKRERRRLSHETVGKSAILLQLGLMTPVPGNSTIYFQDFQKNIAEFIHTGHV